MDVFSIGHSTLEFKSFADALEKWGINAVADVRSSPYSRHYPQYNREGLKTALEARGIVYVFLGKELGGRPKEQSLYTNGVADYEKMAATPTYQSGIKRLRSGLEKYRLAVMCSERSPFDCHRCLLIGRSLKEKNISVFHIIPGEREITQEQVENVLLSNVGKTEADMFDPIESRLGEAYRDRARKVAYEEVVEKQKNTAAE